MSKKSKIQLKAEQRLEDLQIELTSVTMLIEKHQEKIEVIESQIILIKELLTHDND